MFNKNDPLIGAVQEVMKRNQAEREAAKLVNEKFGIHDRKALPHERQHEWDAAYKTVLTEGVEALDEVLDSPEKRMKYGMKAIGSYVKASLTGDKNTKRKRLAGNKNLKKKVEKDTEKRKEDAANNEMARKVLKDMGRKTGYGTIYDKMFEAKIDHPNKRKLDVAKPYGELTSDDFRKLRAMKEEEQIDERVKENKIEKNKVIAKIGAKARKAGDPRHLNNLNGIPGGTGIREPVGDLIRGRELTSGRERRPLEEMMIKVNMEHGADHSRLEKKHNVRVVKPEDPKAKHVIHGSKENLKNFANDVYDNVSPRNIHPELFKEENLEEKITAKTDIGSAIEEFRKSDSPQLAGRSSEKRRQAAIAAVLQARRKAKKMNEGFNNRHGLSVTASAEKQAVADQLLERVGNPLLLNRAKARARLGDAGVRRPISGTNNLQTRLANMRKNAPALDTTRDVSSDKPTTQSNMAKAQNKIQNRTALAQSTKDLRAGTNTFVAGARAEATRKRMAGEPVLKAANVPGINRSEKAIQSAQQQSDEIMAASRAQNRDALSQTAKDLRAGTNTFDPKTKIDARAQGAKVATSTLAKPSGATAQPYGMNVPKKLNPDSRIAKGNVTPGAPGVSPQIMQRGAEQDKIGVKRVEPVKPAQSISNTTTTSAPAQAPAQAPAATPKASTMGGQMTQRDADLMAKAKAGGGQELSKTFSGGTDKLAYLQARAKANK